MLFKRFTFKLAAALKLLALNVTIFVLLTRYDSVVAAP